jgi:hypothetical protein
MFRNRSLTIAVLYRDREGAAERSSRRRFKSQKENNTMNNEYTVSEVIEIGKAQELILGQKQQPGVDDGTQQFFGIPESDLDE